MNMTRAEQMRTKAVSAAFIEGTSLVVAPGTTSGDAGRGRNNAFTI
jgi:hypothetical protein